MRQKITKILSIILPLAVGVFLIIYTCNKLTPAQLTRVGHDFRTANYGYVALALFAGITGFWARAYRWKYTLQHMGYTAPFYIRFTAVCITYVMNMLIPRSGEVARAGIISRYSDVPFDKSLGTIISERVVDLILLIVCTGLTIALKFGELKDYLVTVPYEKLLLYGSIAMVVGIAGLLYFIYGKATWLQKIKGKISGITEGALSVFKMPNKWPFLILSVYIWCTYVLMFYISIFAIPQTAGLSFGTVLVAFVVGSLAITFTNGGVGSFPLAVANVLTAYNIPFESGTAFGWIVWGSQTLLTIILGTFSFLGLSLFYRKK
ncbi:lysylphosphatidylglycerol synthase transmembrane domain-containing protein [Flavobacterium sp. RHBU_3]|uniref:lysylphosphatidylglycerol synthase transmembrane domain-containing protein n=1 Tax=Flavobacterium sp. RHBU_3 TaxID=3391184 RepID=UPI003984AE3D